MKKLYLFLFAILLIGSTKAQFQFCNASFTANTTGATVNFNGVIPPSAPVTQSWYFGDGSTSNEFNPIHTYANCGTYMVYHEVIVFDSTGVMICQDSTFQVITIVCNTPCSAQAFFSIQSSPTGNGIIEFINGSTVASGQPVLCNWNFGDGTTATTQTLNPITHNYTTSGVYTVCLYLTSGVLGTTNVCSDTFCLTSTVVAPTPCNIVPTFTTQVSNNSAGVATFTNTTSPNAGLATWNFGDSTVGTGNIITHTFAQPGIYNVCMHVQINNTCSADTCFPVVIANTPVPCNMVAHFTTAVASTPNTINFVNASVGFVAGDSIRWSFGDGTTSYQINPSHTYSAPGTYQVCLWVKKNNLPSGSAPCEAVLCYAVNVGNPCNLQSTFTATGTSGQPTAYTFASTNANISGATYTWSFGDSTGGNGPEVSHTYSNPGTYQVCLHVATSSTCYTDSCMTITVNGGGTNPCSLNPSFNYQISSTQPGMVVFTNNTITANAPLVTWSFGDSTTGTGNIATHIFQAPGTYTVCMQVTASNTCSADTCITIQISPAPCNLNAAFTWSNANTAQSIAFVNATVGMSVGDSISWNFGDGTTSALLNPVHTYAAPGVYNVCLRISKPQTAGLPACVSEVCHTVIIPQILVAYPNPASSVVNVNVSLSSAAPVYAFLYNSQNMFIAQQIVSGIAGSNTITFNTANLAPGYYTIRLYYNGQYSTARFLKL